MSKFASIARDQTLHPAGGISYAAPDVAEIIRKTLDLLPVADQQRVLDALLRERRLIPASRAGDVLGQIVRFLPERKEWTTNEIKDRLAASGVEVATTRPIFNAIGYLERKKRIERLGNGKYRIGGVGFQTGNEDDLDDFLRNPDG